MRCLWCHEEMVPLTSWSNLLLPDKQRKLCKACRNQLKPIERKYRHCRKCLKQADKDICNDCQYWEIHFNGDPLVRNWSLYEYNGQMREMIAKWKYRGDYMLGEMFKQDFQTFFLKTIRRTEKNMKIVPLPLSIERMQDRGFNQALMLAEFLTSTPIQSLERTHSEKQSKRSRKERMEAQNPFFMKGTVNKPVLLVDDIYTTGTTIRHAASLLKERGCPRVYSYTLVRG